MGGSGNVKVLVALGGVLLLVLLGAALAVSRYREPLPPVAAVPAEAQVSAPGSPAALPWPSAGSAAVWVEDAGLIAATEDDSPRTLWSVTKIMAALVVLEEHPLALGEQGPEVPITDAHVAAFEAAVADNQSAVPVAAGQSLTLYQMLQALMLPSGNNIADILAEWDAGSVEAFVAKMNARAEAIGMADTRYVDVSGNNPSSIGTSRDQALLAWTAMQHPVFAEIVAQPQAELPVAGVIYNVNRLVGSDGNVGVKTGSSPGESACFVFAVRGEGPDGPLLAVGAILGHELLEPAFLSSQDLARTALAGVARTEVLPAGQAVGVLQSEWAADVPLTTTEPATFLAWPGAPVETRLELETPPVGAVAGAPAGTLTLRLGDQEQRVPVVTDAALPEPTTMWRIRRN